MQKNTPFKNLHHLFRNAAYHIHTPQHAYMFRKEQGEYKQITYAQVEEKLNAVSAQMLEIGMQKGDRVAFFMDNCPEYFMIDQGLQQIGLVNASIYPTLAESEAAFVYNDSGAQMIFVGSPFLLKKVVKMSPNISTLKLVVTLFDDPKKIWDDARVISWKEFTEKGNILYPQCKQKIEELYNNVGLDDLATLIYTSGTTGNPKGAMLTHGNFISDAKSGLTLMSAFDEGEKFLSFLPLCHVYERCVTYYIGMYKGAQVAFAESIEKISTNMAEIQPTIIATVPRLMEKVEERVKKTIEKEGGFKARIFHWAIDKGKRRYHLHLQGKSPRPILAIQLAIAERFVFSKIKQRLGGRIKFIVSGGAALPVHVAEFFAAIGIKILEGFGLTETSPFITVNEYERQIIGTVGRVGPGQEVAIQNPDTGEMYTIQTYDSFRPEYESPEGEILMRGPNLMKGYWNQPEETAKVIDKEGWFHTGDIGKFYRGNLKITDRLKNIIVNSFGKNIFPTQVENAYLQSRRIEQIFIIGDKRDYLTAIVIPSKDELKEAFGKDERYFAADDKWITEPEIMQWIKAETNKFASGLAKFERIKAFIIKRNPFSIEDGEMTPKMSVKRKVVEKKYVTEIDAMYSEAVDEE